MLAVYYILDHLQVMGIFLGYITFRIAWRVFKMIF
jgi:hypothetical protein